MQCNSIIDHIINNNKRKKSTQIRHTPSRLHPSTFISYFPLGRLDLILIITPSPLSMPSSHGPFAHIHTRNTKDTHTHTHTKRGPFFLSSIATNPTITLLSFFFPTFKRWRRKSMCE